MVQPRSRRRQEVYLVALFFYGRPKRQFRIRIIFMWIKTPDFQVLFLQKTVAGPFRDRIKIPDYDIRRFFFLKKIFQSGNPPDQQIKEYLFHINVDKFIVRRSACHDRRFHKFPHPEKFPISNSNSLFQT